MAIDPNDPISGIASLLAQRAAPKGQQQAWYDPLNPAAPSIHFYGINDNAHRGELASTPSVPGDELQKMLDLVGGLRKTNPGWLLGGKIK